MGDALAPEDVDAILARIERLEQQGRALKQEVRGLQHPPDGPALPARDPEGGAVTRRRLIGMAGAATAGAVGATVLAASPAGALDPNDVVIDGTNTGATTTKLTSPVAGGNATFFGENSDSSNGIGLHGESTGAGIGVRGKSFSGDGVKAISGGGGAAVRTQANIGIGVRIGAPVGQEGSHLQLDPHATVAGPPTDITINHIVGQFWMDSAGVLFQCVVTGAPGTWVRQAPFVPLATPQRIYNSLDFGPPMVNLQERDIDATTGGHVPPTASAVMFSLGLHQTVNNFGFVGVFPQGIMGGWPGNSNINWFGSNQYFATSVVTPISATSKFTVHCGTNGSTHIVVDMLGYYT